MSAGNDNTGTYTAADIMRYLSGQMTAAEKHAMEKAALEDPFLAEAMEGYGGMPGWTVSSDVASLKQRLKEKNSDSKVVPLRKSRAWWSVAAAILLVSGAATTWYLFNPSPERGLAQKTKKIQPPAAQSVVVPDSNVNRADDKNVQQETPKTLKPEAKKPITGRPDHNIAVIDTEAPPPENKVAKIVPQPATAGQRPDNPLNNKPEAAKDLAADKQGIARSAVPEIQGERTNAYLPSYIFNGRITDSHDKPLPFVNITAGGVQTYTDAQGYFTIVSGDSLVSASVKSIGYEPKKALLASNIPLHHIKLSPGNSELSEVVVVGYASKKAKELEKQAGENEEQPAEPVDGWGDYDIYLSNNKRLPSEKNKGTGGFVEVSFTVNKAGMVYDFTIKSSTCRACNEEAIRLIREGPKWRLTESEQPGKVTITIQF